MRSSTIIHTTPSSSRASPSRQPPPPRLNSSLPSFIAFGRARSAQASLRARSSGVVATAGAAPVTRRRPRTPLPHPSSAAAPLRLGASVPPTSTANTTIWSSGSPNLAAVGAHPGAPGGGATAAALPVSPQHGTPTVRACTKAEWFAAAASGDVLGLVRVVRAGFTEIGAGERGSGRSAMMAGAELGREDVCACVFELARGVGGAEAMYGHRDRLARAVCEGKDAKGRNALHYAAMCYVGEMGGAVPEGDLVRTVRRLAGYGVPVVAVDDDGATPEALARKLGNSVAESALREVGSRLGG